MDAEVSYSKALELEAIAKHAEALVIYKELVKHSDDPRFHIAYGVCLQHLRHWQESAKHLQRGIDLKPHYCEADARLFLAESLMQMGLKKQAIEQWTFVAAMQPGYPGYDAAPNEAKRKLDEHDT